MNQLVFASVRPAIVRCKYRLEAVDQFEIICNQSVTPVQGPEILDRLTAE